MCHSMYAEVRGQLWRLGYLTEVSRFPYLPSHLLTLRSIFRLRKMKLEEGVV